MNLHCLSAANQFFFRLIGARWRTGSRKKFFSESGVKESENEAADVTTRLDDAGLAATVGFGDRKYAALHVGSLCQVSSVLRINYGSFWGWG
jgi:hypothetical protein